MPRKNFALEEGQQKRLSVSWKGAWKNFTVAVDGSEVGSIATKRELEAGQTCGLPDGSQLSVQLVRSFLFPELRLIRDGQPVPGSASDPTARVKAAAAIIWLIAGFNVVLGIVALVLDVPFLEERLGSGAGSIVVGAFFAAMAYLVQSKRSLVALVIATALVSLDTIGAFVLPLMDGRPPQGGGVVVRVLLLIPMFKAIGAIRGAKQ